MEIMMNCYWFVKILLIISLAWLENGTIAIFIGYYLVNMLPFNVSAKSKFIFHHQNLHYTDVRYFVFM